MSIRKKSKAMSTLEKLAGTVLTLGSFMESIRLGEDESLVEFAKRLDMSRSHLCNIEKGRKSVSAANSAEYAETLGYSKEQFVRLALQDEINRSGLKMKVKVEVV